MNDTSTHTPAARLFNRPPRVRPERPAAAVELPEPPLPPRREPLDVWQLLAIPLLTVVVMAGAMAATGTGGRALVFAVPMAAMALVGAVGTTLAGSAQGRRRREEHAERAAFFEEQLAEAQSQLAALAEAERAARLYVAPAPDGLLQLVRPGRPERPPEPRLWERRPHDDDFLDLRLGLGAAPPAFEVRAPAPPRDGPADRRLLAIKRQYALLTGVPITIPLARLGSLGLAGPPTRRDDLLRALLWQAATLHAPGELRLAFVGPPGDGARWEWLRWLDHTVPFSDESAPGLRMVVSEEHAAGRLLSALLDEFSRRRDRVAQSAARGEPPPAFVALLLVVVGCERLHGQPVLGEIMRAGAAYGMSLLCVEEHWEGLPSECAAMVALDADGEARIAYAGAGWRTGRCFADAAGIEQSDVLARRLAGIRPVLGGGRQDLPRNKRLFDMLGIAGEADLCPPRGWRDTPAGAWRPDVPIGERAGGEPLYLDLNQTAHGPHGIIAGTTGAGKSVLLQSIIAALLVSHGPERLNLLLIDFKGGASLAMFAPLAHTVGFVTDLEGRLAERAMIAIKSEIRRRKSILRETAVLAGAKVEDIHDYRAIAAARPLPPLPNLLIVIDEFDELVRSYADFVAELVRVVKQGRSLGVHLLLASQQPSRAVTDEIRTQLKFFIALRLGSSEDSREMLLKTDAAFLPTDTPGRAYFRVGGDSELFQVAQVAGEHRPTNAGADRPAPRVSLMLDGRERVIDPGRPAAAAPGQRLTDLDVLVRTLDHAGRARLDELERALDWRPHPVWRPPLPPRLALAALQLFAADPAARRAATVVAWAQPPEPGRRLRAVVGRVDIPQDSRQEPFTLNLAERHLAIVGAPGSGKTTLLRTLLLSLAANHSPADLWCYAVDPGGQGLSVLAQLPHLGDVVQVRDRERVRRLLHMLATLVRERQELLRTAGASDLPAYCSAHGVRLPAVLLVIDKLALLREEFGDGYGEGAILDELIRLLRVCRPCGVHIVISADSLRDLPHKLLTLLDGRIALRLPDQYDYADLLGGRVSGQIPASLPGRALCALPEHGVLDCQIALPLLADAARGDDPAGEQATVLESELTYELKAAAAELAAAWEGLAETAARRDGTAALTTNQNNLAALLPPRVRLLPEQVTLADLGPAFAGTGAAEALTALVGLESISLSAAALQLSRDMPHALVVGPRRSGKTTALRGLVLSLARRYGPGELQLILVDPHKGGMAGLRELPHVAQYASTEAEIAALAGVLDALRAGSTDGIHRVVVVDDYNLGRTSMKGQFAPSYSGETNLAAALDSLAMGGEHGVHLIVAANIAYAEEGVLKRLDEARSGLVLWPNRYDPGTKLLGVTLPVGERGAEAAPGRALLVREGEQQLVQIARTSEADME